MIQIIKDNRLYFILFALFFIIGCILLSQINQGDVILFFSDHRSPFGDAFFRNFTKMGEEIVYIGSLIVLVLYRFRYAILVPLTAILVTLFSFGAKSFFSFNRPAVFFQKDNIIDQINLIEGVQLLTGPTSFPSGHTMSGFAMYGLIAFLFPKKKAWAVLFFLMALLVGISRMYLVQHFLRDVVSGAACGTVLALLIYYMQARIPYNPSSFWDKGLWEMVQKKQVRA